MTVGKHHRYESTTLFLGPPTAPGYHVGAPEIKCGLAITMMRSLIWLAGDTDGWACSNCRWRCPVPTLLTTDDAKSAYDRLAAVKFREHECESEGGLSGAKPEVKRGADTIFADRARALIKRGYTPKVAVELVLQETEIEYGKDPRRMDKARADAEDFLSKARRGLI